MNHFHSKNKESALQEVDKKLTLNIAPPFKINPNHKNENYAAHLAAIVESTDDAIISKSLQGVITSWNKGSEKMFGYTAEEAVGKPIAILIPAALLKDEKNFHQRIINNEIIDHYETVRIKKNGVEFYVSLTLSPLKDSTGAIIGTSKIVKDISTRKKSEADFIIINKELALQNREKETRAAELNIANKELAFQNEEKENRAAELAIANKELLFQNIEKENRAAELIIANKELAFQNEEKENRAAELAIANKELLFQNIEKENRAAELIIANKELAFQNDEKEKRAAELIIANKELEHQNKEKEDRAKELILAIHDLKNSEEQIKDANKDLESFSYSVSHDLRAPLRAINGYTKMLMANFATQLDPEANRLMNNIVRNGNKMAQLIDDLLTFSRVGRRELVKSHILMDEIVNEICNELKREHPERIIEFHVNKLLSARADNTAIKQVWLNLISNAIKYTNQKEKAVIEISSVETGTGITYAIRDNGAGFDMRYANKLFGVFQRLHSDDEFEGTGVGLALVQRIISKHGGRIWAEAKVNEGATFYFTLNN